LSTFAVEHLAQAVARADASPQKGPGQSQPRSAELLAGAARFVAYDVTILSGPKAFESGGIISGARSQLTSGRGLNIDRLRRAARQGAALDAMDMNQLQAKVFVALNQYADWIDRVRTLLNDRYTMYLRESAPMVERKAFAEAMKHVPAVRSQGVLALDLAVLGARGSTAVRSWVTGVKSLQQMLDTWHSDGWRYMTGHVVPEMPMDEVVKEVRRVCPHASTGCLCQQFDVILEQPEPEALWAFATSYAAAAAYANSPILDDLHRLEGASRAERVFYWRVYQFLLLSDLAEVPRFDWRYPQAVHQRHLGGLTGLIDATKDMSVSFAAARPGIWTTRGHQYIDQVWTRWGVS
jgi:hypothetical protein